MSNVITIADVTIHRNGRNHSFTSGTAFSYDTLDLLTKAGATKMSLTQRGSTVVDMPIEWVADYVARIA